jgi:hypothetical protein
VYTVFWVRVLEILDTPMTTPSPYGWFHLLFFALSVVVGVLLCVYLKEAEKYAPRIILVTAVTALLLEVYKMINFGFSYEDGISYAFPWYAFPWQFCSTPMYVGLLAGIVRRGAVHRSLCAYLATYALFAGLYVMIHPNSVFIDTVGINMQTMICHGSMITIGIYLYATGYVKLSHKTILKAIPVFAVTLSMALIMNEVMYHSGWLNGEEFNMFYISPYFENFLPIYSDIHKAVPSPWNILIYIAGFTAAAYLMLLIAMGVGKLLHKCRRKETV